LTSPTARTLTRLRRLGFTADVVERFIAPANIKRDVFGIGDVLAVHPRDKVFLLVQATTAGHVAHRAAKVKARPELRDWLATGGKFQVWGWRKISKRWRVRVVELCGQDCRPVTVEAPRRRLPQRHSQGDLFGD
jgi:hypothetical protein